ncbi:MAG TPA: serine/threonine-protein kinase, partial [Kofleriaceae bacterium]|nr:serine/threonine-protein kinase [Kofleriaceae bacterium]
MAEILLARAREPAKPEKLVVLKRMHRQLAADKEYVQMFVDEARIATTLRHPNVVEVYEFGEDGDQYYIAMEYLHGHDLRRVLSEMAKQQIPIRLGQALAIASGVCRGLDYTHERTNDNGELLGIVHRDVSPHNVLLTYSGRVKLVDFGIAKASGQLGRTRTGILKGKVAYMSPEQAMGDTLDRRSDVFCIGILLWEMTTGHWLYRRKSELETLKAVVESDAPRPSTLNPNYPPELEQIVMKTLARKREDRWATAGELDDALIEFAKRRRLNLSPAMLGTLMSTVFSEEVAAWQDARRAGASLGDHLMALDRDGNRDRSDPEIKPGHDTRSGHEARDGRGHAAGEAHDPQGGALDARAIGPLHSPDEWEDSGMDLPTTVLMPQRGHSQTQPPPEPEPQGLRWLPFVPWPLPRRWLWLIAATIVALCAAGWLIATVL